MWKKSALWFLESEWHRQAIVITNSARRCACFELVSLLRSQKFESQCDVCVDIDRSVSQLHSTSFSRTFNLFCMTRALQTFWVRNVLEKCAYHIHSLYSEDQILSVVYLEKKLRTESYEELLDLSFYCQARDVISVYFSSEDRREVLLQVICVANRHSSTWIRHSPSQTWLTRK